VFQAAYSNAKWAVTLRENYFGRVAGEGFAPYMEWGGKWLADLAIGYKFSDAVKLTIGGNNIFDVYRDRWDEVTGFPFLQFGFTYGWETLPFGINGGSYDAKLDVRF